MLCDSYFVVTVGELDLAIYRGKKGTKKKEADLEEMQLILEQNLRDFMACPTCTQLSTGRTWEDLMTDKWAEAALTPCIKMCCTDNGEDIPLYLNSVSGPSGSLTGRKPKWKLVQGCGPTTFEMSRAKNGCIYHNSLAEANITNKGKAYDPEEEAMTQEEHQEIIDQVVDASRTLEVGSEAMLAFYTHLEQHKPLYLRDNWHAAQADILELAATAKAEDEDDERHREKKGMSKAEFMRINDWEERIAEEKAAGGEDFDDFM